MNALRDSAPDDAYTLVSGPDEPDGSCGGAGPGSGRDGGRLRTVRGERLADGALGERRRQLGDVAVADVHVVGVGVVARPPRHSGVGPAVDAGEGQVLGRRRAQAGAEFVGDGDIVRVARRPSRGLSRPTRSWRGSPSGTAASTTRPPTCAALRGSAQGRRRPQDLVAGNVRRLERLELRPGHPPDGRHLAYPGRPLQQLQAREASHPRHRLRVHYAGANLEIQSTYPGPTWLDRQLLAPPGRAPVGFAAELESAVRARAAHLAVGRARARRSGRT